MSGPTRIVSNPLILWILEEDWDDGGAGGIVSAYFNKEDAETDLSKIKPFQYAHHITQIQVNDGPIWRKWNMDRVKDLERFIKEKEKFIEEKKKKGHSRGYIKLFEDDIKKWRLEIKEIHDELEAADSPNEI